MLQFVILIIFYSCFNKKKKNFFICQKRNSDWLSVWSQTVNYYADVGLLFFLYLNLWLVFGLHNTMICETPTTFLMDKYMNICLINLLFFVCYFILLHVFIEKVRESIHCIEWRIRNTHTQRVYQIPAPSFFIRYSV